MGLFSSSYKYFAYSATSTLLEEEQRRDTVKSLILQSGFSDESTPYDAIVIGLNTNMYARARSMIRYANKPDGYVRGLPETSQTTVSVPEDVVKGIIEAERGEPIVIEAFRYGPPNSTFFVYMAIHDNYLNPTYFPWSEGLPLDSTWHPEDSTTEIPIVTGTDPPPDPTGDTIPPTIPGALRATVISDTRINLAWLSSLDNVGVSGYQVERCEGTDCVGFTLVATVFTNGYSDTDLVIDTTYCWRVRAIDAAGNFSAYSDVESATTLDTPPPAPDTEPPTAPSALTPTVVSQSQINLVWNASEDNVGVTRYEVWRASGATSETFSLVATPIGNTLANTNLVASTTYRYKVRARDAAGNVSAYSSTVNATTLSGPSGDTSPPTVPGGFNAVVISASQINLDWGVSSDNVGVAGYRVERCTGAGCGTFTQIATPSSSQYNNVGLEPNTTYRYRVRAVDAVGNFSGYTAIVTATTLTGDGGGEPPVPGTPPVNPAIINPSFEIGNLFGWGAAYWEYSTYRARSGSRSAAYTARYDLPAGNTKVPCLKGKKITGRCYVFPYAPQSIGGQALIFFYDVNDDVILKSEGTRIVSGSSWRESVVSGTAPTGTAYVQMGFRGLNTNFYPERRLQPHVDDVSWNYTGLSAAELVIHAQLMAAGSTSLSALDAPAVTAASPYYLALDHPDIIRQGTSYSYKATFRYISNVGVPSTWSPPPFDLTAYSTGTWIMVEYHLVSNPEDRLYWAYLVDSGVYPELEEAIDSVSLNLFYMPVAILMRDKVWFDDPLGTPLDLTTTRLLKDLTLDAHEIKEEYLTQKAIDDAEDDENKSNAEVWDFFIHFGVPIHSRIRGSQEYIWHFLRFLETSGQWTTFEQYQAWLTAGGEQPSSWLHVHEGETTGFYALYGWSYVFSVTYPGLFTPPGAAEPLLPRRMYSKIYDFGTADYAEGIYQVHGEGTPIADSESDREFHDYAVFTRQNNPVDGGDSYTQVLIMAPSMFYKVNTSEEGDLRERYVDVTLFPEDEEDAIDFVSEFRYPVHIGSLRATATMHREEMLQDALASTVYLVEKVKVKWYQKGFFTWLIIIIVVIVVVLAWQYHLLPSIATLALAATGATALALWTLYFVVSFAIGFLISFAGGLIGGTWGQIFVIVASMYLAGGPKAFTNPMSSWSSAANQFTTSPGWGTAFSFIQTVAPVIQRGVEYYNQRAMAKADADMRDFEKSLKEKYDEIRDAWDQLGVHPPWLDPLDIARIFSQNYYLEEPEEFFRRTLNANPGVLGYDLIQNFAGIATRLPEQGEGNILEKMFEDLARQRGEI